MVTQRINNTYWSIANSKKLFEGGCLFQICLINKEENMKLIKALSEKNKLARNIKDIQGRITKHNSYIAGNSPIYDTKALLKELNNNIDALVDVKAKIANANLKKIESVYRLSEMKSLASFLKKLVINEGKVKAEGYNSDVNEWECELSNIERDKLMLELESKIENLQMEMDQYNFETEI